MAKILTVLSIILAGIVVAGMHPPLSAASIACIILLMAGAVVLYHEMSALGDAKSRSQGKYARGGAQTQANRYAASGSWVYPGVTYPGVERRGDSVKRGQVIATAGRTAVTAQPQLHFELRHGSTPVDPLRYLENVNITAE